MGDEGWTCVCRVEYRSEQDTVKLTGIELLILACEFDVDKVYLELFVGLDSDQQRRTATGCDDFIWVMGGFEDKCK